MTLEYPKGFTPGFGNCGIVSIAAATNSHIDLVWEWFRKRNNRPGQWRGTTYMKDYIDALSHFGKSNSKVIFKKSNKQKPIPLHYWVRIFENRYPGGTFLVCSFNHAMLIKDGFVLDQSGIKNYQEHASKGRRIVMAWLVE